jgi:branched-chain amino acid transport system substrate-binding protein
MKRRRCFATIGSIFMVLCMLLLVFPSTGLCAAPEKTLTIGYIAAMTGFAAIGEVPLENGARVAQDWINDNGGITVKGEKYRINIVTEDHKCNSEGAIAAASKLVNDQKIKFIAGGVMPFTNIAINSVTGPAKVLHTQTYNVCTPDEYGPRTPYTFVTDNGTVETTKMTLAYMSKAHPNVKTIAVSHPDDGAIPFIQPMVTQAAKENGMTVVGDVIGIAMDMIDFTPVAKKLMARNADAICMCNGWASIFGGVLKVARQSGYTKPIWQTPAANCQDILTVAGKENTKLYCMLTFLPGDPKNPPVAVEMQRRLKAKYGHEAMFSGAAGFDTIWLITQAIEAAQSFDPTVVRDKWETMKTMKSVYGTAHLGGLKTYGINHTMSHPAPIVSFVDGVPKVMKWMDAPTL